MVSEPQRTSTEMSTSLNLSNIPQLISMVNVKLTSRNYLIWKSQIQDLVISADLLDHSRSNATHPTPLLTSDEGKEESNPEYKSWRKTDRLLKSLITTTVSENILNHIIGLDSALEV